MAETRLKMAASPQGLATMAAAGLALGAGWLWIRSGRGQDSLAQRTRDRLGGGAQPAVPNASEIHVAASR